MSGNKAAKLYTVEHYKRKILASMTNSIRKFPDRHYNSPRSEWIRVAKISYQMAILASFGKRDANINLISAFNELLHETRAQEGKERVLFCQTWDCPKRQALTCKHGELKFDYDVEREYDVFKCQDSHGEDCENFIPVQPKGASDDKY